MIQQIGSWSYRCIKRIKSLLVNIIINRLTNEHPSIKKPKIEMNQYSQKKKGGVSDA